VHRRNGSGPPLFQHAGARKVNIGDRGQDGDPSGDLQSCFRCALDEPTNRRGRGATGQQHGRAKNVTDDDKCDGNPQCDPVIAPDGRTLFYLDRLPPGVFGVSGTSKLMQVPVDGGKEAVVLDGVRFGLWSVTQDGIVFLTVGPDADEIAFYGFSDRGVRRLGTLPFRASRIAGLGRLPASWDGRWLLVSATDVWESNIMVVDGVR
jgi:hypothetical protein